MKRGRWRARSCHRWREVQHPDGVAANSAGPCHWLHRSPIRDSGRTSETHAGVHATAHSSTALRHWDAPVPCQLWVVSARPRRLRAAVGPRRRRRLRHTKSERPLPSITTFRYRSANACYLVRTGHSPRNRPQAAMGRSCSSAWPDGGQQCSGRSRWRVPAFWRSSFMNRGAGQPLFAQADSRPKGACGGLQGERPVHLGTWPPPRQSSKSELTTLVARCRPTTARHCGRATASVS